MLSKDRKHNDKIRSMTNAANKGRWLDELLVEMGWTSADLARASGLDSAVVSNIRNGKRGTGFDTALKIAKALKLPPEQIYQAAGLLPPKITKSWLIERIIEEMEDLLPEDKEDVMDFIEMIRKRREKKRRKKL